MLWTVSEQNRILMYPAQQESKEYQPAEWNFWGKCNKRPYHKHLCSYGALHPLNTPWPSGAPPSWSFWGLLLSQQGTRRHSKHSRSGCCAPTTDSVRALAEYVNYAWSMKIHCLPTGSWAEPFENTHLQSQIHLLLLLHLGEIYESPPCTQQYLFIFIIQIFQVSVKSWNTKSCSQKSSKQNWSSDINLEVYDCSHTLACRLHMSLTHHHWRALTQVNHIMDDFCCLLGLARTAIDIQIPGRFGSEVSLESLSLRLLLMVLAAEHNCIPLIDKLDTMETCMGSMCRQVRSRDP